MKRIALLMVMFVTLAGFLPATASAAPVTGTSCAYCGWFFVFGDPKPFDDCFDRIQACFKESKRMPGQSVDACMCAAMRDLLSKYNKWDLLQRNLGWLYGAAGAAAGVSLPGQGLINPDERENLLSGKGKVGDYIDQLGEFGGRYGEIAGGIAHAVEDTDKPYWRRAVGGVAAVLPEGNSKTVTTFIDSAASLRD